MLRGDVFNVLFDALDSNHNGKVELRELWRVARSSNQEDLLEESKALLQKLDLNGDRTVSREEFMAVFSEMTGHMTDREFSIFIFAYKDTLEVPMSREERLTRLFYKLDSDVSGYIEMHELRNMVGQVAPEAVTSRTLGTLEMLDEDRDGRVSLDEFLSVFAFLAQGEEDERAFDRALEQMAQDGFARMYDTDYVHPPEALKHLQEEVMPVLREALLELATELQRDKIQMASDLPWDEGRYRPRDWRPFNPLRWLAEWFSQRVSAAAGGRLPPAGLNTVGDFQALAEVTFERLPLETKAGLLFRQLDSRMSGTVSVRDAVDIGRRLISQPGGLVPSHSGANGSAEPPPPGGQGQGPTAGGKVPGFNLTVIVPNPPLSTGAPAPYPEPDQAGNQTAAEVLDEEAVCVPMIAAALEAAGLSPDLAAVYFSASPEAAPSRQVQTTGSGEGGDAVGDAAGGDSGAGAAGVSSSSIVSSSVALLPSSLDAATVRGSLQGDTSASMLLVAARAFRVEPVPEGELMKFKAFFRFVEFLLAKLALWRSMPGGLPPSEQDERLRAIVALRDLRYCRNTTEKLRFLFHSLDADRSQLLTLDELRALARRLSPNATDAEIEATLHYLDGDNSNTVSEDEFIEVMGFMLETAVHSTRPPAGERPRGMYDNDRYDDSVDDFDATSAVAEEEEAEAVDAAIMRMLNVGGAGDPLAEIDPPELQELVASMPQHNVAAQMSVSTLLDRLAGCHPTVLVDVRPALERDVSSLPGSVPLAVEPSPEAMYGYRLKGGLSRVKQALATAYSSTDAIAQPPVIVTFCSTGERGGAAALALSAALKTVVYNLCGGIINYYNQGGQVVHLAAAKEAAGVSEGEGKVSEEDPRGSGDVSTPNHNVPRQVQSLHPGRPEYVMFVTRPNKYRSSQSQANSKAPQYTR